MAKSEVGVIGLGKFGSALARTLKDLGGPVVGLDLSEANVKRAQDYLDQVYVADGTDALALRQLGFADFPHVVVSIGHSMEASILITLNLKELGVPQVWVKALSPQHEKILYRLGADLVVFPERYVAEQLAHRLAVPGLLQYLPLGGDIVLQELTVDKWQGKTLRELDLPNKLNMQIVAVRRQGDHKNSFLPRADTRLQAGDVVVAIGDTKHLGES